MAPKTTTAVAKIPAVAYLRCSDPRQETSVKDQRLSVKKYAEKHGYEIVREYADDGISGDDTEKRKAFLQMSSDAASGRFKFVLCWDQSRFGRFDSLDAGHWIFPFRKSGVKLVTLDEGVIDWEKFETRVMYALKQEGKHELLRDLSRTVLERQSEAAKNGSWIGSAPFGFKVVGESKNKRLESIPQQIRVVKRIFKEYVTDGRSLGDIARRLNDNEVPTRTGKLWRFDSVRFVLENRIYLGEFIYNRFSRSKYNSFRNGEVVKGGRHGKNPESDWVVMPGHYDAVIDKRTFDRANAILAKGKHGRTPFTPENNPRRLAGLLKCGHCGEHMHGHGEGAFRCPGSKKGLDCPGNKIHEAELLEWLSKHILSEYGVTKKDAFRMVYRGKRKTIDVRDVPKTFPKLYRMFTDDLKSSTDRKQLEKQKSDLEAKIKTAERNLGHVDVKRIPVLERDIQAMEKKRDELALELSNQPTETDIFEKIRSIGEKLWWLSIGDADEIKPVLREIDSITVHTKRHGFGVGTRYEFVKGEVRFLLGEITGKENPSLGIESAGSSNR